MVASPDPEDTLLVIRCVSATLSIIGSCWVIITFIAYPQLRRFFSRLVLFLAVSDLWLCASVLLGQPPVPHYTKCMVQSAMGSFFGLSSVLWTAAIADALHRVVLCRDLAVESGHEARLHVISWGVPLACLALIFSTGVYGQAGGGCWIRNSALGSALRFLTFYVPLWLVVVYSSWVYWNATDIMERLLAEQDAAYASGEAVENSRRAEMEHEQRSLKRLLVFPLLLVLCWAPSSIRRIIDIFEPDFSVSVLDYLSSAVWPLQGLLNAVFYGATPAVRDAVFGRLEHSTRKLRAVKARLRSTRNRHFTTPSSLGITGPSRRLESSPNSTVRSQLPLSEDNESIVQVDFGLDTEEVADDDAGIEPTVVGQPYVEPN